ncbi:MAG: hypothetical protein WCK64_10685 [Synechococcaceae cyanobacterium ELA445]
MSRLAWVPASALAYHTSFAYSMRKPFTAEEKQRIRKRYRGYGYLLVVVSLTVLVQPLALNWPLLTSMNSIIMAMVMMIFLTRYSLLRFHRSWLYGLGSSAIVFEVIWLICMAEVPGIAKHLTLAHLLIWALFIGYFLIRCVRTLMLEPFVTVYVLMGACTGYLLIGYAGAFLLHSLMLWQPEAMDPAYLPAGLDPIATPLRVFPSMVCASFEALTTLSNAVTRPGNLSSHVSCMAIAVVGQLYVAMLIGLILGRFQQGLRR